MARAAKTTTTDIESLKPREAGAKHILTTELESLVSEEERAPKVIRYKRNTDLDPQLVWRGKHEQDTEHLMVDAAPIPVTWPRSGSGTFVTSAGRAPARAC